MFFQSKLIRLILLGCIVSFLGCDRKTNVNEPDDGLPPVVPSGLTVYYANDGTVELIWVNNNEADLKGYNLYRSVNDTLNFRFAGFTSSDYFVDDSLYYDSTYYYYLTAIDFDDMESSPSSVVSGTPSNRFVPQAPRNLQINARNWNNKEEIFLWWERGFDTDLKGYNIYRSITMDFTADSSTFLDFSSSATYFDNINLELYRTYYYKITAVDKGDLESRTGNEVSDQILEVPELLFPLNNNYTDYFEAFKIKTVAVPARYRIILQSNQFFGEIWSYEFSSQAVNDTIDVKLTYWYMERNKTYYWRVAAYSENSTEPNSISDLYNFTIKP